MLHEDCGYCGGQGFVKTDATVAYEIFRENPPGGAELKDPTLVVNCNAEVARLLQGDERQELRHLMDRYNKTIQVRPQTNYHREQYDLYGRSAHGEDHKVASSSSTLRAPEGLGQPMERGEPAPREREQQRDRDRGHRGGRNRRGRDRDRGERGDRGEKGERGEKVDRGERGEKGDRGDRGTRRSTGAKRSTEARGAKGRPGRSRASRERRRQRGRACCATERGRGQGARGLMVRRPSVELGGGLAGRTRR